jgi:UDP-2,3-diacylglucosamine hydrolase
LIPDPALAHLSEPLASLAAPVAWQRLEFISDLHLHEEDSATFGLWQHYLETSTADAVFILGDLFEAWVGDDALDEAPVSRQANFEQRCKAALEKSVTRRPTYFLHGNRDFLVGAHFFESTGVQLLADPCVLTAFGSRYLLSHGDALCIDDKPYMQWRAMVRTPQWQDSVLSQTLPERRAFATHIRVEKAKLGLTISPFIDVNAALTVDWLTHHKAHCLVHGHTHHPLRHDLGTGLERLVLSDWDGMASPPRAEVLRLDTSGWQRLTPA